MSRIINLGSLCVDHVYQVDEIAGAANTIASHSHNVFPGGKGLNQSLAAAKAGAGVAHAGAVGDDGQFLIDLLASNSVDVSLVLQQSGASGHAMIQVDNQGQNAIVIAGGTNRSLPADLVTKALAQCQAGDWLLLQNEINDVDKALLAAQSSQVRVALNVAPVDGREAGYDLSGLDLLVVNEIEAQAVAGTEEGPTAAFTRLRERLPNCHIVLTQGGSGLLYGYQNQQLLLSAYKVTPVDETAAGDSFIGYLMAALAQDRDMLTALGEASAAGALAVTRAGAATSIPTKEEVAEFVANNGALQVQAYP